MGRCLGAGGAGEKDRWWDMTTPLVDGNQMILILDFLSRRIGRESSKSGFDGLEHVFFFPFSWESQPQLTNTYFSEG